MNLGFNLSIANKSIIDVKKEITEYYKAGDTAIELSLTDLEGILEFPFSEIYDDLLKFKYISVHLPVIYRDSSNNKVFLTYPSPIVDPHIKVIQKIADTLKIKTYVLHPDQVKDFNWCSKEFGKLLGFENMDNRKEFGKSIQDMQTVFDQCPEAKWIFDINHLYTNDPTMESAKQMYETFKTRLTHYHISAFGGFHSSFTKNPHELVILKGVLDNQHPLIHEGYKYSDLNISEELNLIKANLD